MMRRFMLVDDEPNVLHALRRALNTMFRDENLRIETFTNPEEALARVGTTTFDLVMSDYRMPQMTGIEFLKGVRSEQPDAVRLVLSASTDFQVVQKAINDAEVFRFIAKPWQPDELESGIRLALARRDELLQDRRMADEMRLQRGQLTAQELEARRLEEQEPGITR